MIKRLHALCLAASLGCASGVCAPSGVKPQQNPLEPARAALRNLQFDRATQLLSGAGSSGNHEAQYLLGLMYLNGIGVPTDPARADELLQSAAEGGYAAAAFVLAGEISRMPESAPQAQRWLERAAQLGYQRAVDALQSGRPLLASETLGASDPTLLTPWVIECVRKDHAQELRRIGAASASVRDEFGSTALSLAAGSDSMGAAAALIELGADIKAADTAGTTALMIAAAGTDPAMIDLLLGHGADVQTADNEGRTPLFYAARANRAASVLALKRAGATLEAHDSRGYNALDAATIVGADEAAMQLRELGSRAGRVTVDPARPSTAFDPAHPGDIYKGWTPLPLAVVRDDIASLQRALTEGESANLRLPQGAPLIHVAADARALNCLTLLLVRGADPIAVDRAGHSALWLAAARNDAAVVKAILAAHVPADAHANGEQTPLLAAMGAAHPAVAQLLLAAGANADAIDPQGRTALMLAAAGGSSALIEKLLEYHASIDAQDHERRTALLYAAAAGSYDGFMSLLNAGANIKAMDAHGASVLHAATRQPKAAVLAVVLERDPQPLNQGDEWGDTPLLLAAATGHTEIVQALLAHSPELNLQNRAGDTALIAASRGGYQQICHLLLAAGANKQLRNGSGISASDVASARGFKSIATELSLS